MGWEKKLEKNNDLATHPLNSRLLKKILPSTDQEALLEVVLTQALLKKYFEKFDVYRKALIS